VILFLTPGEIRRMFMSDILRLNGNSKRLKVKVQDSNSDEVDAEKETEENYIQTNLQNYYDRGFNEGRESTEEELKNEFGDRLTDQAEKFSSVLSKLNEKIEGYDKVFSNLIINLSFMIAEKIIHSELTNKTKIEEILQISLKKVIGSNNIIVKLNPEDFNVINKKPNALIQQGNLSHIKLEPDENIEAGGCYIETEIGNVDARISTQLSELKKMLEENF